MDGYRMAVWGMAPLRSEARAQLEHDYRHSKNRLHRQRSQIVLLCTELSSQAEVARMVRCSSDTVQRTLTLYHAGGVAALRPRLRLKYSRRRTVEWQKALSLAMQAGPEACGVPRPTWSVPLLVEHLAQLTGISVSLRTLRRGLASLGYVCRRGTWSVRHKAEEDPDYAPKGRGSRRS